jgi:hypothetical protein
VELFKKKASNLQEALKCFNCKKELAFDVSAAKTFPFL